MVRRCVGSRNLVNEEPLANWGLLRQKQTEELAANRSELLRGQRSAMAQSTVLLSRS